MVSIESLGVCVFCCLFVLFREVKLSILKKHSIYVITGKLLKIGHGFIGTFCSV